MIQFRLPATIEIIEAIHRLFPMERRGPLPGHVRSGSRYGALDKLVLHQYAEGVGIPWIQHDDPCAAGNQRFHSGYPECVFRACLLDDVRSGPDVDDPAHAAPPSTLKGKGLNGVEPSARREG